MKNKTRLTKARLVNFMFAKRKFLGGSYLEYGLIFLFFVLLTIIYTNFIALNINSQVFTDSAGDGTAGFLWYNFAEPGLSPLLNITNFVSYPYGEYVIGPAFVTYLAIWMPLRVISFIFGPVAGINILTMWGFISAGMGAYWLLKRLTKSIPVSLFAGFAIAYVPYNIYKATMHLPFIFCIVFVLMLAAFIALWLRPSKLRGVLFGASIALAVYTNGYFVLLAAVMTFGLVLAGLLQSIVIGFKWSDLLARVKALFIALFCLLILLVPIIYIQFTQSDQIKGTLSGSRGNIGNEIQAYRANIIDFVLPPKGNPLLSVIDKSSTLTNYKNLRSNPGESMMYVGYVIIILVVAGFIFIGSWLINKKNSTLNMLSDDVLNKYMLVASIAVIVAPLFVAFMFSPEVYVLGHTIHLPGRFLIDHNIAMWRVLSRFFIPLHVILVVFASFTLWIMFEYNKVNIKSKKYKIATTVFIFLLIIITGFEYYTSANRPSFDFNNQPQSYKWLKEQSGIKVIAELPIVDPLDSLTSEYVTAQVYHGKKLINTKEVDGRQLSNVIGGVYNNETIDFAFNRGAQAIVTHGTSCDNFSWGSILVNDEKNGMCVYRLERAASGDDVFAKFNDGFIYSVGDRSFGGSFAQIINNNSSISFVGEDFVKYKSGDVHLVSEISPMQKTLVDGSWSISQNGKVVASGQIVKSYSKIDAILSASSDAKLSIDTDSEKFNSGDLVLTKTIVDLVR